MMATGTGGCLCGAIRYELDAPPLFTAICHCRQCRRQTGSAYSLVAGYPADAVRVSGDTATFAAIGDSGLPVIRHFCAGCGSPILSRLDVLPEVTIIKAGTLDADDLPAPTIEVFCDDALAFVGAMPGAERFARSNLS